MSGRFIHDVHIDRIHSFSLLCNIVTGLTISAVCLPTNIEKISELPFI